jgi:precorrin-2 dehydrogenase/sirohydrochlorin ferrochelatase
VLVSVCDDPSLCDFISPAIVRDENICIAVTSNATDVKRSIRIRDRVKDWIGLHRSVLE